MSAPTPGPWCIELDLIEEGSIDIMTGDDCPISIASVDCRDDPDDAGSPPREQALANARLIAAAPRMAALLLSAYQHVSHGGPKRGDVKDVLREAGLIS